MMQHLKALLFSVRLKLALAILKLVSARSSEFEYDIVFVLPPRNVPGWILEAICREVAQFCDGKKVVMVNSGNRLPVAKVYFCSHYMYYVDAILKLRISDPYRGCVFATHLESDKHGIGLNQLASMLNYAKKILCMNSGLIMDFESAGVDRKKMVLAVGAANSDLFLGHNREPDGRVGFCSAFYERKSPEVVYEICRLLKNKRVVLIGRGWEKFDKFKAMLALPNFEYIDTEYENYPALYASMSVFVSVSKIEGGPIPLLEAMLSNVVPVVGNTGFAEDVIINEKNGYIFDLESTKAEDIVDLIYKAYNCSTNIRESAMRYNWQEFSINILGHIID